MVHVCIVLSAGMLKMQHEDEMDMTSSATGCEWRCLGEQERGVLHQPLPPSEAAALASESLSRASPLVPHGKTSRLVYMRRQLCTLSPLHSETLFQPCCLYVHCACMALIFTQEDICFRYCPIVPLKMQTILYFHLCRITSGLLSSQHTPTSTESEEVFWGWLSLTPVRTLKEQSGSWMIQSLRILLTELSSG